MVCCWMLLLCLFFQVHDNYFASNVQCLVRLLHNALQNESMRPLLLLETNYVVVQFLILVMAFIPFEDGRTTNFVHEVKISFALWRLFSFKMLWFLK